MTEVMGTLQVNVKVFTVKDYGNLNAKDRGLVDWWLGLHLSDWRDQAIVGVAIWGHRVTFYRFAKDESGEFVFDGNELQMAPPLQVELLAPFPLTGYRR